MNKKYMLVCCLFLIGVMLLVFGIANFELGGISSRGIALSISFSLVFGCLFIVYGFIIGSEKSTKGIKMARKKSKDNINPEHYTEGQIEFIDYAKESMSKEAFEGGLEFNIKKYTHRWKEKDGVQDLKKAEWYLQRLIKEKE